jgi:hypothetical protein
MRFVDSLTVPAGTAYNQPVTKVVKLSHGTIAEVEIMFPAGCGGLVHFAIDHYEHQAFPTNPDASFIGDDQTITMNDSYPVLEAPYSVKLRGWAPTATLDHTVYVEISVAETQETVEKASLPVELPEGMTA